MDIKEILNEIDKDDNKKPAIIKDLKDDINIAIIEPTEEKTTMAKLLMKLYDVKDGEILAHDNVLERENKVEEYIQELRKLGSKNPELAKKVAIKNLQKVGIVDENGKIKPPYNGEKVHEDDFTRGPGEIDYGEER